MKLIMLEGSMEEVNGVIKAQKDLFEIKKSEVPKIAKKAELVNVEEKVVINSKAKKDKIKSEKKNQKDLKKKNQ